MGRIRHLSAEFPTLGAFLDGLEPVFLAWPAFRDRVFDGFRAAGPDVLGKALAQLEALGVRIPVDSRNQRQISALWESDFFRLFLDAVGFFPPENADPGCERLPPVSGVEQAANRELRLQSLYATSDYWKVNLQRTYPEVFLEPALPESMAPLAGCDLACGWGRATLSLRNRGSRVLHCCDHSVGNLRALRRFIERSGECGLVTTHCSDIACLPLADDSLDFSIALDLFELLPDESLETVLLELLRCHKPGAALYCKVTLHARAPVLGQVQYFTRDHVIDLFTRFAWRGKRLRVKLSYPLLPEHFTFKVIED